jgi:TetR/AcrR family transcriptional repressor of lmrAB and yxaGH operons
VVANYCLATLSDHTSCPTHHIAPHRAIVDRSVYFHVVSNRRNPSGRPRKAPTRDRLVDATADLLQRQGYAATGLAEITAAAAAPRGSLYFHFPGGKEQLAAEALQRSSEAMLAAIAAAIDASEDGPQALQALTTSLGARLQQSEFQRGCPVATTALEAAAVSPALREAAHQAFTAWLAALRLALQADGREPAIAEEQAVFALSAIEGALVLARAARSTRPLRVVSQQLVGALAKRPA